MTSLTHDLILSVATQEAAVACANLDSVLSMGTGTTASLARRRAMVRILRETGCDPRQLAKLWGCDPCVVYRARNIVTPPPSVDVATANRLQWAHGAEKAASIVNGTDLASNLDQAAWRALGRRPDA